jgi:hypothetical protein
VCARRKKSTDTRGIHASFWSEVLQDLPLVQRERKRLDRNLRGVQEKGFFAVEDLHSYQDENTPFYSARKEHNTLLDQIDSKRGEPEKFESGFPHVARGLEDILLVIRTLIKDIDITYHADYQCFHDLWSPLQTTLTVSMVVST